MTRHCHHSYMQRATRIQPAVRRRTAGGGGIAAVRSPSVKLLSEVAEQPGAWAYIRPVKTTSKVLHDCQQQQQQIDDMSHLGPLPAVSAAKTPHEFASRHSSSSQDSFRSTTSCLPEPCPTAVPADPQLQLSRRLQVQHHPVHHLPLALAGDVTHRSCDPILVVEFLAVPHTGAVAAGQS